MTKEELAKEAEEYLRNLDECKTKDMMRIAYLAGAEPREKRIAELEAQIEKMKKCENCKHHHNETYDCRDYCYFEDVCKNHEKWEIKEK